MSDFPRQSKPAAHGLDDAVASITSTVARRLTVRYVPLFAAVAVVAVVALVAPSQVDAVARQPAVAFTPPAAQQAAGGGDGADGQSTPAVPTAPSGTGAVALPAPPARVGSAAGPAPASPPPAPVNPPAPDTQGSPDPGDFADGGPEDGGEDVGGFNDVAACPIEFGEEPVVSRDIAAVLLGVASPALSLLGPFGPNAVPALGALSPVLPVIAPLVDALGPYIRLLNPVFLQLSQLGTALWEGPLQPLEDPLLQLNAAIVQPLEVELLAALAGPLDRLNATPLTPCLQRLVYNLVAALPIPAP